MPAFLVRWLKHPRLSVHATLVAVLLVAPSLWAGLAVDDYIMCFKMRPDVIFPGTTRPLFDLFSFLPQNAETRQAMIEVGYMPWWTPANAVVSFLRPVSAATHLLDNILWPSLISLHHVQNILWFAAAILVVGAIFRRIFGTGAAAGLATVLFAFEDAHAMPASWLANRNSMIALVFGGLGFLAHVRWRTRGRFRDLVLFVLVTAIALLAGESALGALAFVAAWQLVLDRGGWRRRLQGLLPAILLVLAWRAGYEALGYGAYGSGMYIDPGRDPGRYLRALVERGPALLLGQWLQVPVDIWVMSPRTVQLAFVGAGVATTILLAFLFLRTLRASAVARFWTLGMIFGLVPLCAAFPMDRLLLFAGIGAFGLLAAQAERLGWLAEPPGRAVGRIARFGTAWLLILHLPVAFLLLPTRVLGTRLLFDTLESSAREAPADEAVPGQTFVFLHGLEMAVFYLPLIRETHGSVYPRRLAMLCPALTPSEISRTDERTLVIRPEGGFLGKESEQLMADPSRSWVVGERVRAGGYEVEVLEITADARVASASFRFEAPLEDPQYRWLAWKGSHLTELSPPLVGETMRLEAMPVIPEL